MVDAGPSSGADVADGPDDMQFITKPKGLQRSGTSAKKPEGKKSGGLFGGFLKRSDTYERPKKAVLEEEVSLVSGLSLEEMTLPSAHVVRIAGALKRQIVLHRATSTTLRQMRKLLRLKKPILDEKNVELRKQTESVLPVTKR